MARPTNTEQRRTEILDAFLNVMARDGYAKATIQAIAKEAGLGSGIIHYHFTNKQEILIELVRRVSLSVKERHVQLSSTAQTPQEKLKAFIDSRLAKNETANPVAVAAWVVIATEAIRQPEVRIEYEKIISLQQEILEKLLAAASASNRVTAHTKKIAAISLAAIEGAFQLSVAAQTVMPTGYAAESLYELLRSHLEKN